MVTPGTEIDGWEGSQSMSRRVLRLDLTPGSDLGLTLEPIRSCPWIYPITWSRRHPVTDQIVVVVRCHRHRSSTLSLNCYSPLPWMRLEPYAMGPGAWTCGWRCRAVWCGVLGVVYVGVWAGTRWAGVRTGIQGGRDGSTVPRNTLNNNIINNYCRNPLRTGPNRQQLWEHVHNCVHNDARNVLQLINSVGVV